jgi:sugar phosphate isomerase/epimerase
MIPSNRRDFLFQAGLLGAGALLGQSFHERKYIPRLSFSTLGCPDWTFEQAMDFAAMHGYSGIEVRGIGKEMELTLCPEFSTSEGRASTMQRMKDRKLSFSDLGSSCNLHVADPIERRKNLDEGRRYIDLAAQIGCPHVRVFPNSLPKEKEKAETLALIAGGLLDLADHAKGGPVIVLMETHGDLVHIADIETVMNQADHPHAGLVWDIVNMWIDTGESPEEAYPRLKHWIRHTHIKDARKHDGKIDYLFMGQGETPIFNAIDLLAKDGYKGYFSFEWEKRWHPEIAEPEAAFADYAEKMRSHFK